jgi:hypothetical protein
MAVTGTMEIGEGNKHLDAIHISLQTSRQNEKNLKSTEASNCIFLLARLAKGNVSFSRLSLGNFSHFNLLL